MRAGIDVPVLRGHDVVKLAMVRFDVLADGSRHRGPALDRQRAALAEVVLDVDNNQCP